MAKTIQEINEFRVRYPCVCVLKVLRSRGRHITWRVAVFFVVSWVSDPWGPFGSKLPPHLRRILEIRAIWSLNGSRDLILNLKYELDIFWFFSFEGATRQGIVKPFWVDIYIFLITGSWPSHVKLKVQIVWVSCSTCGTNIPKG